MSMHLLARVTIDELPTGAILSVGFILVYFIINLIYYLFYMRSMKKRSEKRLMWFALFILLGPIAITSYLYSRDPLLATKGAVNKAYDVVDHIAIPWLIYLSLLPFFWMVTLFFLSFFFDGFADGRFTLHDHVTEALFWVFLMVLFVVFFIILPLLILAIIIKVILYFVQKKSSA